MNHRKTINHFIKNFLHDLPSKLRKKIAEVVLVTTLSGSLRISRVYVKVKIAMYKVNQSLN
ncbi:MAG: hypothetical protein ABDH28_07885 [Brevinematia bacterium]